MKFQTLYLSAALFISVVCSSLAQAGSFQLTGNGYLWMDTCNNCADGSVQQAQPSQFVGTLSLVNGQWRLSTAITGLGDRQYDINLSVDQDVSYVRMSRGYDRCADNIADNNGECGSWLNAIGKLTSLFPIMLNGYMELSGNNINTSITGTNSTYWVFIGNYNLVEIQ